MVRPDAIVNVPGGLKVVIDAKAPLENFLRAHEAEAADEERDLLAGHAAAISRHAKALGDRDYAGVVAGSPDFVLMFVPADPILDAAMKVQPTLWEQAWREHRVLIATPGLLLPSCGRWRWHGSSRTFRRTPRRSLISARSCTTG